MVIVVDKLFNSSHQLLVDIKAIEIIHPTLQDTPEAFHRAVVDTSSHSGHALCHSLLVQLRTKLPAGILESPVTVEQRVCIRILLRRQIESLKYQLVVVALANGKGDDVSALQIEDCTEIGLLPVGTIFHLCYIRTPFLVYFGCRKISVQNVFGCNLRRGSLVGRTPPADDSQPAIHHLRPDSYATNCGTACS